MVLDKIPCAAPSETLFRSRRRRLFLFRADMRVISINIRIISGISIIIITIVIAQPPPGLRFYPGETIVITRRGVDALTRAMIPRLWRKLGAQPGLVEGVEGGLARFARVGSGRAAAGEGQRVELGEGVGDGGCRHLIITTTAITTTAAIMIIRVGGFLVRAGMLRDGERKSGT